MATKYYGINDKWTDDDIENVIEITSEDGSVDSVKVNGEDYGGGGGGGDLWDKLVDGEDVDGNWTMNITGTQLKADIDNNLKVAFKTATGVVSPITYSYDSEQSMYIWFIEMTPDDWYENIGDMPELFMDHEVVIYNA